MQIQDVGREDNFNYELQYANIYEEELVIQEGDVLVTTCIYDSMDKTEATPGGLGSQDEMCVGFLLAYPSNCCAIPPCYLSCQCYLPVLLEFPYQVPHKQLQKSQLFHLTGAVWEPLLLPAIMLLLRPHHSCPSLQVPRNRDSMFRVQ